MAASCKVLGDKLSPWAAGGDAVQQASGLLYAGRRLPREIASRARRQLAAYIPLARNRKHGWTAADVRELRGLIRGLRRC